MSSEMTPRARSRPSAPAVGTILVDDQGRVGEFRDEEGGLWWLRPLKGGTEWTVEPGTAEPTDLKQRLHAEVTLANARTERRKADVTHRPSPRPPEPC